MTTLLTRLRGKPWLTLLLALLLITGYLASNNRGEDPLWSWYQDSGLHELEWQNYLTWLHINDRSRAALALAEQARAGDPHAWSAAFYDRHFQQHNQQPGANYWSPEQHQQWQALDKEKAQIRRHSPAYQWGLSPAQPRPGNLLSAPLLNPYLTLLLPALLLLAFAAALERQLGAARLLLLWLLGCMLSALGYLLLSRAGHAPLYGAGPATLVFAGAWLRLNNATVSLPWYAPRLRQWRTLAVPGLAFVVVPLLLSPLIVLNSEQPWQALLAAALCSGLAGALLVPLLQPAPPVTGQHDSAAALPAPLRQQLAQGWQALGEMQAEQASQHFDQVLSHDPEHFDALTGQFSALRLSEQTQRWQPLTKQLLCHPAREPGQPQQLAQCWQLYQKWSGEPLDAATGWPLVATLARARAFAAAEQLAASLPQEPQPQPGLSTLVALLEQEGLGHRAEKLQAG